MQKIKKDRVSIAIKNAGRGKISKERFEQLLFELATFHFALKDIDASTKRFKKILQEYTGAKGCTFMFLDKYDYLWKIGEKTTYPFKLGEGIAGWVAMHKKYLFVGDIRQDTRYRKLYKNKNGAIVSFPITNKGETLGVLSFTYKNKKDVATSALDKEVIDFFIEKKLKYILENIILFHDAEEERNELSAKESIANILDSSFSNKRKIDEVTKKIVEFVGIDKASVLINDIGRMAMIPENSIAVRNKLTKSKVDLVSFYKSSCNGKKEILLDISTKFGNKFITSAQTGYSTLKPIYSGKNILGFILIEDKLKNVNNFSTKERGFLDLTSKNLGKYFTDHISSKKIIEEKERWRMIFQNDADGIVLLTRNKKIIEANPKAKELFGSKGRSLTGKNLFSLFKILDPELKSPTLTSVESISNFKVITEKDLSKKIDAFFDTKKIITPKEYLLESKNGRFWTSISMNAPIGRDHIEPFGVVNIRDITKRKELEQNKDEFISIVSHELRTPLTAMKGFLSMILSKDYGKLNEKQSKSLGRVSESVERMVDLVEDLLDSSRIELGRFCLIKEPVDILDVTCETVRELGPKIREKNIKLQLQGEDIRSYIVRKEKCKKADTKTIYVTADKDRLMRIIQNLLDNAIKYSFPNSMIEISLAKKDSYAELSVKDNGVGISERGQKDLFKKFHRIHNPLSAHVYGTGLGLYITRKLVKAHDGEVTVKSLENHGTTFTVRLPIAKQLSLDLIKK